MTILLKYAIFIIVINIVFRYLSICCKIQRANLTNICLKDLNPTRAFRIGKGFRGKPPFTEGIMKKNLIIVAIVAIAMLFVGTIAKADDPKEFVVMTDIPANAVFTPCICIKGMVTIPSNGHSMITFDRKYRGCDKNANGRIKFPGNRDADGGFYTGFSGTLIRIDGTVYQQYLENDPSYQVASRTEANVDGARSDLRQMDADNKLDHKIINENVIAVGNIVSAGQAQQKVQDNAANAYTSKEVKRVDKKENIGKTVSTVTHIGALTNLFNKRKDPASRLVQAAIWETSGSTISELTGIDKGTLTLETSKNTLIANCIDRGGSEEYCSGK